MKYNVSKVDVVGSPLILTRQMFLGVFMEMIMTILVKILLGQLMDLDLQMNFIILCLKSKYIILARELIFYQKMSHNHYPKVPGRTRKYQTDMNVTEPSAPFYKIKGFFEKYLTVEWGSLL